MSKHGDFTKKLDEYKSYTLFDLYRLGSLINKIITDPIRNAEIKNILRGGMEMSYFSEEQNTEILIQIMSVEKKRVRAKRLYDGAIMSIPFYLLNTENINKKFTKPPSSIVRKEDLKIGEVVSFYPGAGEEDKLGIILRLNSKTATLRVDRVETWRVCYGSLHKIIDGEMSIKEMLARL